MPAEAAARLVLLTDRLALQPATPAHAAALAALMHPRASRMTVSWPCPLSAEAAARIIARHAEASAARQGAAWAITRRADACVMGWLSARIHPEIAADLVLLSYWVGMEFEGLGVVTEAARAVRRPVLALTQARRLGACIFPGNQRSVAVARRLGLHYRGFDHHFWSEVRQAHELTHCYEAMREELLAAEPPIAQPARPATQVAAEPG